MQVGRLGEVEMADPADFLDYGEDLCPSCRQNRNLSLGGRSIFCPVIQICRLCRKAETLVNKIWSACGDQEKLKYEVERQLEWSFIYIEHEMTLDETVKDVKRMQDLKQAKQMMSRLPEIIAKNSTRLEYTFAQEFPYHQSV